MKIRQLDELRVACFISFPGLSQLHTERSYRYHVFATYTRIRSFLKLWEQDMPAFSGARSRLWSIDGDCRVDNTGRTNEYKAGKHIRVPFLDVRCDCIISELVAH